MKSELSDIKPAMQEFTESVYGSRAVRRFYEDIPVEKEILTWLVNNCRFVPSAGNRQATRFIIINGKGKREEIFPTLGWLGYLSEDMGPKLGERPSAYIVLLHDKRVSKASIQYDAGIISQTINLGANRIGLACCIIGAVNRQKAHRILDLSIDVEILTVIALGWPKEVVKVEESKDYLDVKYWRDEQQVHHVPKLPLKEVLIGSYCG